MVGMTLGIAATLAFVVLGISGPSWLMSVIVLTTAILAALDSHRVGIYRYQSGIAFKPFVILIGFLGLWIVAMPWYIALRYSVWQGTAKLKDEFSSSPGDV